MAELPLAGKPSFRASAMLVGERLSLRAWMPAETLATNPLAVAVHSGGVAVLFRYGVAVFFGATPAGAAAFLAELAPQVGNPYPAPETEEVEIRVDPGAKEGMKGEALYLEAASVERLQVIADVLSKSVVLAYYEARIGQTFDRIEPLASDLERHGRVPGSAQDLLRHIGAMLRSEQLMVGRAQISEKPEILWDMPVLEGLFLRLEDEFELRERHAALERKLGVISRTAETLNQILDSRHMIRVEWYIVVLIVVEIGLTLYELFIRAH